MMVHFPAATAGQCLTVAVVWTALLCIVHNPNPYSQYSTEYMMENVPSLYVLWGIFLIQIETEWFSIQCSLFIPWVSGQKHRQAT